MNEQENLAIAKQLHSAFVKGDINLILNLITEDAEWQFYGPADIPCSGRFKSRGQIIGFLNSLKNTVRFIKIIPLEYINSGDSILIISKIKFRIEPAGKIVDTTWFHNFTIKNGKVVCVKEYPNTTSITEVMRAKRNPFLAWLF